jgi:aryl-alcohol dehydrogenase-like predicted oxidoreductase
MVHLPPFLFGAGTLHTLFRRFSLVRHRRVFELLDVALEEGCWAIDSGTVYGGGYADRVLGKWMRSRRLRERIIIIGKGGHPHRAGVSRVHPRFLAKDLDMSLRRMREDYIDLYMVHRDDPAMPVATIMDALHRFVQAGKVRALGASNWSHQRIAEANRYAEARGITPLVASSPHFSLAEWQSTPWPGCLSIGGATGAEARAWYAENKMPVLAWSPLGAGFLAGRDALSPELSRAYRSEVNLARRKRAFELAEKHGVTPAAVALAYARAQPFVVHPIVGASSPAHLRTLLRAARLTLTAEEIASLS